MSLYDNLESVWRLEEVSGVRADSRGTNHLTDNNTVTQGAGKVGNCGQFTKANTEYLSLVDNASISVGDIDYGFHAWVLADSLPGVGVSHVILSQSDLAVDQAHLLYLSNVAGTTRFIWAVYDGGATSIGSVTANTLGTPSTATWYDLFAWHSATDNQVGLEINGVSQGVVATSGAAGDSNVAFNIGAVVGAAPWDGRIDEVMFIKNRIWTPGERAVIRNGGNGIAYPFPTGGARLVGRGLAA